MFIRRHIQFILVITLLLVAGGFFLWHHASRPVDPEISESKLTEIKGLVKLCSLEVRDDVAIKDSINGKWIFAKSTVNGYIRFDLEKLDYQLQNDSVIIFLPPEEIEVYESDRDNSYQVIDTWNQALLDFRPLTSDEETAIKQRMARRYKDSFYEKGYVARARASAVATLSALLSKMDGKISIVDLHPQGCNNPR